METILNAPAARGHRAGVRRMKKHDLKTDMTPMVDLGFLLIAFFVVTAELSKPKAVSLNMPHDGPPMPLGKSNALTFLVGRNNTVHYYEGDWDEALAAGKIFTTSFSARDGLGRIIREKQQELDRANKPGGEGRDGLMLLIKADDQANYENIIDALDEALIHTVKKYAIVKLSPEETGYLRSKN